MSRGVITNSAPILSRIIEHFGLSLLSFGFRPGEAMGYRELEDAIKARPGAGMLLTAARVAYTIESIDAEDFNATPDELAQRALDLTRATRLARIGYRHDDPHEGADHAIAVAALTVTDRMTPELLSALLTRTQ